jgi:ABC-type multidrug transport system ATPase subunit
VRVFGESPYDNTTILAEIGFVAQDTPLYRDFTAAELVTMGDKLNRRWDSALARQRLAQLGIPPNQRVGKLSGGQRAQVALALALAKRPRLLLLDEPLASLDPLARRDFLQYQPGDRFWAFQGIETVIFVALAALLLYLAIRRIRRIA